MERKTMWMLVAAAAVIAIVIGLVAWSRRDSSKDGYSGDGAQQHQQERAPPPPAQQQGPPPERPELVLFWSNGCGHCHQMMPEWQKLCAELQGKFQTVEIEGSNPAVHQFGIQGFPTIRLYPRGLAVGAQTGEYIQYSGPRTAEALMQFVVSGGQAGGTPSGGGQQGPPQPQGPPGASMGHQGMPQGPPDPSLQQPMPGVGPAMGGGGGGSPSGYATLG